MTINQTLPAQNRMPWKPLQDVKPGTIIFSKKFSELDEIVSFRSLDLNVDLEMIHSWMNQAYSRRFWQLDRSVSVIRNTYQGVIESPGAHSFIGMMDNKPFCLIDLYMIARDELADHIPHLPGDCGLHLLMCPPREMQKGWSIAALNAFKDFYFSFSQCNHLYAEPDTENHSANKLAIKAGFKFLKEVQLSYKKANLYCLGRQRHIQKDPESPKI